MVMLLAVTTCSWRWLESFPATKTRLLAVLLIALQCVIPTLYAVVFTGKCSC